MSEFDDRVSSARDALVELSDLARSTADELAGAIAQVADEAARALRDGGTLFFCGNGGSAADAQHLAAEYVVRFARDRGPLSAMALTTDTSVLTAAGNDFGFEEVFARQVTALARPGDVLFLHSTSGSSANLLRAAEEAERGSVTTVALLARGGGALRALVSHALVISTDSTPRAQEIHLAVGHAICGLVEKALAEAPGR